MSSHPVAIPDDFLFAFAERFLEEKGKTSMIPDEVIKQLPALHSQDSLPDNQLYAYARLTHTATRFTWFVLEIDSDEDLFSGYLFDPSAEQFGYFSIAYLEEHLGQLSIEYDEQFTPKPLAEAVIEERRERRKHGERMPSNPSIAKHRAYYYAAWFIQEPTEEFERVRALVEQQEETLSAFLLPPLQLQHWHILIIGDRPSQHVHEKLQQTISDGILTKIPYDMLMLFVARKRQKNAEEVLGKSQPNIRVTFKKKKAKKSRRDPRHRGNH